VLAGERRVGAVLVDARRADRDRTAAELAVPGGEVRGQRGGGAERREQRHQRLGGVVARLGGRVRAEGAEDLAHPHRDRRQRGGELARRDREPRRHRTDRLECGQARRLATDLLPHTNLTPLAIIAATSTPVHATR
jgi:hypothetical protein